jgi:hypothetical protein
MRSLLAVCVVLALTAGVANAANPGQVPDATLAQLGLSGLQTMSDVQGTDIRGMGFASVSGVEIAKAPGGSVAINGYNTASFGNNAKTYAVAGSIAVSGIGFSNGNFVVAGAIAGGGAYAYAK